MTGFLKLLKDIFSTKKVAEINPNLESLKGLALCSSCELKYEFRFGEDIVDFAFWVPAWHPPTKTITSINLRKPFDKMAFKILAQKREYNPRSKVDHISLNDYYLKKEGNECPKCLELTLSYKYLFFQFED